MLQAHVCIEYKYNRKHHASAANSFVKEDKLIIRIP